MYLIVSIEIDILGLIYGDETLARKGICLQSYDADVSRFLCSCVFMVSMDTLLINFAS